VEPGVWRNRYTHRRTESSVATPGVAYTPGDVGLR
jgi:hypothetical protein